MMVFCVLYYTIPFDEGCTLLMQALSESKYMVLLIGVGVLIFIIINWKHLKAFSSRTLLLTSFIFLVTGFLFSIIELFIFPDILNVIQHAFFALSSVFLLIWMWQELRIEEGGCDV